MVKNRKNLLESICEKLNFNEEVNADSKLPFRLLLEIDTTLNSSTLVSINEKLNTLMKINLEMPMSQQEVMNAIASTENK